MGFFLYWCYIASLLCYSYVCLYYHACLHYVNKKWSDKDTDCTCCVYCILKCVYIVEITRISAFHGYMTCFFFCLTRQITVKEVLTVAHFDTGLVALTSPAVKCQCCQIFVEKQQQRQAQKTLKHPNSLFYNTKKIICLISATDHFTNSMKCLAL